MYVKPAVYVINLERCVSRRESISCQLIKHGLDFEIFNAVDGRQLKESELSGIYSDEKARSRIGRSLSREEIGCYLSHINICREIVEKDIPYTLILEDDAILNKELSSIFHSLAENRIHWDIAQLHYFHGCLYYWYKVNLTTEYKLRKFVNVPWRSTAYILSGYAAGQILKKCFPLFLPIDDFIYREMKYSLKIRGVHPVPVDHKPEYESASTMEERNRIKKNLIKNISKQRQLVDYIKNNTLNLYKKFDPFFSVK